MPNPPLPRRRFLGGGTAALALAQLPPSASAQGSGGPIPSLSGLQWASGVRDTDPDAFVTYRDRPIDVLLTYSKKATWAEIRGSGDYNYKRLLGPPGNRQETIVVSYPLFPIEQNPRDHGADLWRRAANGEFDWHHDAAAASFTRYSQQLVFRPGWEWNVAGFAPWTCTDVELAADYITYFRRIVDRLRAHLPSCLIDWCPGKKGRTNASIDNWYPGGGWVDFVGHDKYDWYTPIRTEAEWDQDYICSTWVAPAASGRGWPTPGRRAGSCA